MMTKNLTRAEAAGFLLSHDRFAILTHRLPDGDTVGSAAALCRGLRMLGKTAYILEPPESAGYCDFLLAGLTEEAVNPGDILVAVDVAEKHMLPKAFADLADHIALRIDHHAAGAAYAAEELVDGESASCAELVWDVLAILGLTMDQKIAEAGYGGISTDTGCFRFANTTTHTFRTAAICTQAGADIATMNRCLFETNSLAKLRLQSWMTDHLELFGNGELALVAIPRAVEELLGVNEADLGNISNFARSIEGVCMAATLRQTKDGRTKISVRGIPGYDAAAVCARFGGGGHKGAAGATTSLPLEEAAKAVKEAMLEG